MVDEVDIGYIGFLFVINGFVKINGEIKIIVGAVNGGMMLVLRCDLNIKSLGDLKGERIVVF